MRADRGAVDGASVNAETGAVQLSVIGGGRCSRCVRLRADRAGGRLVPPLVGSTAAANFTDRLPAGRASKASGERLWPSPKTGRWRYGSATWPPDSGEGGGFRRHYARCWRAGAGPAHHRPRIVSGNFGRFLNLPAALGIGLLRLPAARPLWLTWDNGSLEGAALGLALSANSSRIASYLNRLPTSIWPTCRVTLDEFVGASFLPAYQPRLLRADFS